MFEQDQVAPAARRWLGATAGVYDKLLTRVWDSVQERDGRSVLARLFPILSWAPKYNRQELVGDLKAGVSVAFFLVGEAIALSLLAGLPPQTGIFTVMFAGFTYSLVGNSSILSVGPVSLSAVITGEIVASLPELHTEADAMELAHLLCLEVAIVLLFLGVFDFGFLESMLAHSAMEGFLCGMAFCVIVSQLTTLLGMPPLPHHVQESMVVSKLNYILHHLHQAQYWSVVFGLTAVVILAVFPLLTRRVPAVPLVSLLAIFAQWWWEPPIKTIGFITPALPVLALPTLSYNSVQALFPKAALLAIVGWIESITVARRTTSQGQGIQGDDEMIALSLTNLVVAVLGGFPALGSFLRSVVVHEAGAKTQLAGMFGAGFVALIFFFASPILSFFPKPVVAAIISVAVSHLVHLHSLQLLFLMRQKRDVVHYMVALFSTVALGIDQGLMMTAVVSILYVLRTETSPRPNLLGKLPDSKHYTPINADNIGYARAPLHVSIAQPRDTRLYYANAQALRENLTTLLSSDKPPKQFKIKLVAGPDPWLGSSVSSAMTPTSSARSRSISINPSFSSSSSSSSSTTTTTTTSGPAANNTSSNSSLSSSSSSSFSSSSDDSTKTSPVKFTEPPAANSGARTLSAANASTHSLQPLQVCSDSFINGRTLGIVLDLSLVTKIDMSAVLVLQQLAALNKGAHGPQRRSTQSSENSETEFPDDPFPVDLSRQPRSFTKSLRALFGGSTEAAEGSPVQGPPEVFCITGVQPSLAHKLQTAGLFKPNSCRRFNDVNEAVLFLQLQHNLPVQGPDYSEPVFVASGSTPRLSSSSRPQSQPSGHAGTTWYGAVDDKTQ